MLTNGIVLAISGHDTKYHEQCTTTTTTTKLPTL